MQLPKEEGKRQASAADTGSQQKTELSEAWRALLGLSGDMQHSSQTDPATQVQPLASDPWSHLVRAQGMQPVDLQKVHLHDLRSLTHDDDVEHALDLMQEANGQSASGNEKTGEIETRS